MDYGSQKMEELIEKIEHMSVEEFNALYERAEKDLELFSPSFEQVTDGKYQLISHDVSIMNTDMLINSITHVPVYAVSLSMFADNYVLPVSGLTTTHLEVSSEYSYGAFGVGLGRGICTLDSSSYEIITGETVDHPASKEEEGDAWALAA